MTASPAGAFLPRPLGPPIVYLDTADYSRFADLLEGRSNTEVQDVWDYLLPLVDSGAIRIGISMPLISEALQYEGGGPGVTIRKARVMERLCGKNAFRYIGDIIEQEIMNVAVACDLLKHSKRLDDDMPFSYERRWYPSLDTDVLSLSEVLREELATATRSQGLHRRARRVLQARLPRLLRQSREVFSSISVEAKQKLSDWPGIDQIMESGLFAQAITGLRPPRELERGVFGAVCEPENFVHYYFVQSSGRKTLPSWMKNFGNVVFEAISDALDKTSAANLPRGDPRLLKIVEESTDRIACNVARRMLEQAMPKLRKMNIGKSGYDRLWQILGRNPTPTTWLYAQVVREYVFNLIRHPKNAPSPRASDGGDLINALYIPYCHIWRGDKRTGPLFTDIARQFGTTAVGKLADLPPAIESVLDKKIGCRNRVIDHPGGQDSRRIRWPISHAANVW